jgi:hypothetical protein
MISQVSNGSENQTDIHEKGIDIPYDQINPETLRKIIEEFVTKE